MILNMYTPNNKPSLKIQEAKMVRTKSRTGKIYNYDRKLEYSSLTNRASIQNQQGYRKTAHQLNYQRTQSN